MNLLEHNARGATIQLDQRELLLVMALIQEGRESFGCNTDSGKALDQLFSSANVLVEGARRSNLEKTMLRPKPSVTRGWRKSSRSSRENWYVFVYNMHDRCASGVSTAAVSSHILLPLSVSLVAGGGPTRL